MKKQKEVKKLSISEKMKAGEDLGSKVAIIMNVARAKANKLLEKEGYGVDFRADFYRLEDKQKD